VRATLEVPSDQAGHVRLLGWPTPRPPAGGSGPWKGRAAMGRG
jgi:hypothetical protein